MLHQTERDTMTTTTYASDLGKCYAKAEDGFYRLYKVDGYWTIYLVSKELIWDEDYNFTQGTRLEATRGGFISHPDEFLSGVYELQCEAKALARDI
jgi:hypothetical protein